MADEIQNTGIQFEDIVPWVDDHGDTGLSARLKLKRNFDKIKAWMDSQGVDRDVVRQMIENMGAELFLSKVEEDVAAEQIGFMKGFWIKAKELFGITGDGDAKLRNLDADGLIHAADIQSPSYTGDGMADTGFRLTARDNTGSSKLTVDNLYVRKKATFEELEVRKETAIAGNQIYSGAANVVIRTEYYGVEDTTDPSAPIKLLGFSILKTPWLLKKVPFLLRGQFFGRTRKTRIYLDAEDIEKIRFVRCYFLAKDDEREVYNLWKVQEFREVNGLRVPVDGTGNDLARCQTMNLRNSKRPTYIRGFESKAGNVYWWRKLCGVSSEPAVLEDGRQYHFIDITFDYAKEEAYRQSGQLCPWCDLASGDIPAAGDHVVQFGNDMNPDRMNLIAVEVNSSGDAPAQKFYRGIYTFDLTKCWWGGSPRKAMLSPSSGYEFYGPNFKVITEYGIAPVPKDRTEVYWSQIALQRDDYGSHTNVRKCYYYDAISNNGSRYLCLNPEGVHWVRPQQWDNVDYALFDANGNYRHNGNYISDVDYNNLDAAYKAQCGRVPNYTTIEPSTENQVWKMIVEKGEQGTRGNFKSTVFVRQNTTPSKPTGGSYDSPVPSGWNDGIPDGEQIVWASECTFYGAGGSSGWTTPRQLTDTADFDVDYSSVADNPGTPSTNPSNWSNTASSSTIWMATREKHNGVWSSWQVSKIKGEKGQDGQDGQDGRTPVKGVDYFDGQNGKDGWMVTANPANVIITQNLDTQSSFTTATVTFAAKKGNVSASISSIGTPSSSTFNVSKSGNSVVVSSPKTSGGNYYSEGNFEVAVNVTDPDTRSVISFNLTVFCYANLLGTWKQSVENGEEIIAAQKIVYTFGKEGVATVDAVKNNYDSVRNASMSYQKWSTDAASVDGSMANMKKNTTEVTQTANGTLARVNAVITDDAGNSHITTSEIQHHSDTITSMVYSDMGETGIVIDGVNNKVKLVAGKVEFSNSTGSAASPYFSVDSDGKMTANGGGTIGGFDIGENSLGESLSSTLSGTTHIRKNGHIELRNPSNADGGHPNGAIYCTGGVLLQGDANRPAILSNANGETRIYGLPLNLNTLNGGNTYIGSAQSELISNSSKNTFANETKFNSSVAISGFFAPTGSVVTGGTFRLPYNPTIGQTYFCKSMSGDMTITIPYGFKLLKPGDNGERTGSVNIGERSDIIVYMGNYKWVEFWCG